MYFLVSSGVLGRREDAQSIPVQELKPRAPRDFRVVVRTVATAERMRAISVWLMMRSASSTKPAYHSVIFGCRRLLTTLTTADNYGCRYGRYIC